MSKLELMMRSGGGAGGKVIAQVFMQGDAGRTRSRSVVLQLDEPTILEVDPGHVMVQVQLPSGQLLSEERTLVHPDDSEAITFGVEQSRQQWLGWQHMLSPKAGYRASPESSHGDSFIASMRLHRGERAPLDLVLDDTVRDGPAGFVIHTDPKAVSLTIEHYRGRRPFVEIVHTDETRQIACGPLPWLGERGEPLAVQLITERCSHGTRADVIVHDPELSPILAYYATGNLAAARELASGIEARAASAVMGESQNPGAGVAAVLIVRALRPEAMQERWLASLGEMRDIADGAILHAQYLMDRKAKRPDPGQVRSLLLDARSRGVPVFAQCGRMLRDALRRLWSISPDDEIKRALDWANDLVCAQRTETIISWLSGDDDLLSRVVPDIVPPATHASSSTAPGDRAHLRGAP